MTEADSNVQTSAFTVDFLLAIVDHVAHPIFVKDRDFRFVFLNQALCRMTGYNREQMLGKTDYDFFPKEEADFFRLKDEEVFATNQEIVIDEEPITDVQGIRHVLATTKVPLRNASGVVTYMVGITHDITQLKAAEEALRSSNELLERRVIERTAELAEAQRELLRRERLAVLGQLSGGLAHQIRNPLAAITNATAVLRKTLHTAASPAEAHQALQIIQEEVWQANRIITDLLEFARVRPPHRRAVDTTRLISSVIKSVETPSNIHVELNLLHVPAVWVDEDQVRSALTNLIRNAVEAMPEGGVLSITAQEEQEWITLSIRDTGPGVPAQLRDRLFEPLVTTKPFGFGLGLSTARALLRNQGGELKFRAREDTGAEFRVRLPRTENPSDMEENSDSGPKSNPY